MSSELSSDRGGAAMILYMEDHGICLSTDLPLDIPRWWVTILDNFDIKNLLQIPLRWLSRKCLKPRNCKVNNSSLFDEGYTFFPYNIVIVILHSTHFTYQI